MKKLYVAALYSDNNRNKQVVGEIVPFGFENTTRWMLRASLGKPYTQESVAEALKENLEDMRNADAYLVLPQKELAARGCYVEFGYILAQVEQHPERPIYLISNDDPAFHWFHPKVKLFTSVEELKEFLIKSN